MLKAGYLFEAIDADVYHSESFSSRTYLAKRALPRKKHIITSQDPQTKGERKIINQIQDLTLFERTKKRIKRNILEYFKTRTLKSIDYVGAQAKYIIPKVKKMYDLEEVNFLPNPVQVPSRRIEKSNKPTVSFLARWDRVKQPEKFLRLATKFPKVQFIAMGKSVHSKSWAKELKKRYRNQDNLTITGFVSEERKSKILEKSWVMINTSKRECLPISFLEAAAHKCAILSANDPDGFANNFGYWVKENELSKFVEGLKFLLEDNEWKKAGERGFNYVKENHEYEKVINTHLKVYKQLL